MTNLIVIQARQTSSRLPNKVFLPLFNIPLLYLLYSRLSELKNFKVVFAVPSNNLNLISYLESLSIPFVAGDEHDVHSRFVKASRFFSADNVIRVNCDCPFLSPSTIVSLYDFFVSSDCDYTSTTLNSTYALGEHVEIFTSSALYSSQLLLSTLPQREHVTPVFYQNPSSFVCLPFTCPFPSPTSNLRLCIDYPEDYTFFLSLSSHLNFLDFDYTDILNVIARHPELTAVNSFLMKERTV